MLDQNTAAILIKAAIVLLLIALLLVICAFRRGAKSKACKTGKIKVKFVSSRPALVDDDAGHAKPKSAMTKLETTRSTDKAKHASSSKDMALSASIKDGCALSVAELPIGRKSAGGESSSRIKSSFKDSVNNPSKRIAKTPEEAEFRQLMKWEGHPTDVDTCPACDAEMPKGQLRCPVCGMVI